MKNTIKSIKTLCSGIGLLLLLLCSSTVYSQNTIAEELIGTWSFDQATSFATIAPETKAHMDTIPQIQSQLLAAYSGRKVFFGSDGMYRVSLADGRSATGTWQLTLEGELRLTDPSGNVSYQQIVGLQGNRLVLIPIVSGSLKSIIKQQHFVKL